MAQSITLEGQSHAFEEGMTAAQLFEGRRDVVAIRLNGAPADLDRELVPGDDVAPITLEDQDGLDILRHSAGHVVAQAVQELFPGATLGIGPFITDGFYFDFGNVSPFTPDDLKAIEKRAKQIIKEGQTFHRVVVSEEDALARMASEPFSRSSSPPASRREATRSRRWRSPPATSPCTRTATVAGKSSGRTSAGVAPALHQADRTGLRRHPRLRRVLARRPGPRLAPARLRDRLGEQGRPPRAPGAPGGGGAPRPPQAGRGARPLLVPG